MLERDLLLNATAAILLACLAWQHAAVQRRLGATGFALVVAGALLPFVDTGWLHLTTADRIELLSHGSGVRAPLHALALIAAGVLLASFVMRARVAATLGLWLAAGYALHVVLAVLTPMGWPLLAPFSEAPIALPLLPQGHPPLLGGLLVGLVLAEARPTWRRWLVPVTTVLGGVYLMAGAAQFAIVSIQAQGLATEGARVHVYPDDAWLTSWQVVVETPDSYALRRQHAFSTKPPEPKLMPRWNDQPLFLKLLGDPVVNRFYFHVFQHPVVRLDLTGSQITLLMQEMRDQSPLVPGPTFYLESDLTGRKRFYQLQRFN